MKKYTLTLNPSFMMDAKKPHSHDFNSPAELYEFLVETLGYDDDIEIKRLIEVGGHYYEPSIRERKDFGVDPKKDSDFEIIVNDIEKTPFNDVDLFIKEYRGYLIGKKINVDNELIEIKTIDHDKENDSIVFNLKQKFSPAIDVSDLQRFIDGEKLEYDNYNVELQLQNEKPELNSPDNKYYIVATRNDKTSIVRGFEYKEDAKEGLEDVAHFEPTIKFTIVSKKDLASVGIDPNNESSWHIDQRDYDIVELALNEAVVNGDFNEARAKQYLQDYRAGKLKSVIKTQLFYLHGKLQQRIHRAFMSSNIESINASNKLISRIESEMLNIIKAEN